MQTSTETPRRGWRVWAALVAPPFMLALAFFPIIAIAMSSGLQGDALMKAVQDKAPLPASLAFVATFILVRFLAKRDGLTLPDVGWRRPTALDVISGAAVALAVHGINVTLCHPSLREAQPSFDPRLTGVSLPVVVVMLGLGMVAEDTLYRGYAWKVLSERHGPASALLVTTLFYVLLAPGTEWPLKVWTLGFGAILGAVRWWRGNVWPVVIVHAVTSLGPKLVAELS